MAYIGFESGVFPLPNQLSVLASPETTSSSEKLSSPKHSSDYCEYISPEEKYQEEDSNY